MTKYEAKLVYENGAFYIYPYAGVRNLADRGSYIEKFELDDISESVTGIPLPKYLSALSGEGVDVVYSDTHPLHFVENIKLLIK